jgi:hypothetical protein
MRFESKGIFPFHHFRDRGVFHYFGVDTVAMGAGFESDPGKHNGLAALRLNWREKRVYCLRFVFDPQINVTCLNAK